MLSIQRFRPKPNVSTWNTRAFKSSVSISILKKQINFIFNSSVLNVLASYLGYNCYKLRISVDREKAKHQLLLVLVPCYSSSFEEGPTHKPQISNLHCSGMWPLTFLQYQLDTNKYQMGSINISKPLSTFLKVVPQINLSNIDKKKSEIIL